MPGPMAISRVLGLFATLSVILFHRAWFPEPHAGRRLLHGGSETFLESLRSNWDTTLEDTSEQLRPCLYAEVEHHLGALVSWVSSAAAKASDKFRWAFLEQPWAGAAGLACAVLLAAAAYAAYMRMSMKHIADRGYHALGVDEVESRERLQAQFLIAASLGLSVADIVSDIYVATTYFRSGLIAFGSLLVAITLGSGVVGFVLHRASWERADEGKNIDFWAQGLNEQGERQPGVKDLVLYVLQIKPLLVAYESFQLGSEAVVLVREKVLAQLSESVPSALLQAYALAVAGAPREGTVFFLILSLGLSLGSMADAANKGYRRLCAPDIDPGVLPEAGLLAWRCADVGGRICGWALLGMALRPVDASRRGVQQPWLPAWILVDIAVSAAIHKLVLQKPWESLKRPQDMLELLLCAVTIPWGCLQHALLQRQLRLQRVLLLGRSLTTLAAAAVVAAKYGSTAPDGTCPLTARPALASLAAAAVAFSLATLLTAAVSEILLRWNVTLFPVAQGLRSGPLHLAVRLGSVANVQRILAQTGGHEESLLHVHEAAHCCDVEVLRALYSSGEAMDATDERGRRPIHFAAAAGSVGVLRFLAETEAVADAADEKGITAAHMAAEMGHVDALEVLHKAHAVDLEARDEHAETAAHKAARGGHAEALRMLSQAKADLEAKDEEGCTPAHLAAEFGRLAALDALREAKVELGAKSNTGRTPAWLAASEGHAAALRLLQQARADLGAAVDDGRTPALMAAQNGHREALEVLRQAGADLAAAKKDGRAPAHYAAQNGHLEALRLLLEAGADLAAADENGVTPALLAAEKGHAGVLRLLQEAGADLAAAKKDGVTPAYRAAQNGHLEALRLLLEAGADLAAADENGVTPALLAAEKGHAGVLRLLQEAGADLAAARKDGRTPAHFAAQNGHLEALWLLLEARADLGCASHDGTTPAQLAAMNGHAEALQLLREAGADLVAADENGVTPALLAAAKGHAGMLRLLQEAGADLAAAKKDGITPAHRAAQNGHLEALRLLLEVCFAMLFDGGPPGPSDRRHLRAKGQVPEPSPNQARADLGCASHDGTTPAQLAAMNGHAEALQLLREAGADLVAADENGWTPALLAAQKGHAGVLRLLQEAGADLAAAKKDGPEPSIDWKEAEEKLRGGSVWKDGATPALLAALNGHAGVLRLLQEAMACRILRSFG
ncbi:ANK2 [Symbiodinium sp. CCMP2592]|nr:ANK2 [Symbiodinium sp. CCMP2592]